MAIKYTNTLNNSRADAIATAVDAGAGAGLLRIYNGTQPAKGGTATTLLAELTFSDPSFAAAVAGVLTANAITGDAAANATGTATWFRIVDSNALFVLDGTVGTSGADLNLNDVNIVISLPVDISSMVLTEGNL